MAVAGGDTASFGAADYAVVGAMLLVSLSIGVYQACTGGKQRTAEEFLMANRNMNPIPVALSLIATYISAITFIGTPSENYVHGIMHVWNWLATSAACLITMAIFMPIFYHLRVTSSTEYLGLRFNRPCRLLGTCIVCLHNFAYLGIVLYAPSLALNSVTGLNLWASVVTIGTVCTLYTSMGGMKAVLWTDVCQITIMMIGFIAVIIQGSIRVGGLDKAWHIAAVGERLDLWVWNTDVTVRHTVWGVVIGGIFTWLSVFGVGQTMVQRYLTCGSIKTARIALWIAAFGMVVVLVTPHVVGIVMYANYAGCDPKMRGVIERNDEMMPYFIMDLFGSMPGLPGLLISAVFSAALSTLSSGLNGLSAVAGEDIVKGIWPNIGEYRYTLATKGLAIFFGALVMCLAIMASQLGDVVQTATTVSGVLGGPLLGLFCSGMLFPWVNSKGAFVGTLLGLTYSFWLGIGAQLHPNPPDDPPLTIANCPIENTTSLIGYTEVGVTMFTVNVTGGMVGDFTTKGPGGGGRPAIVEFYKLSYVWYGLTSWLVTTISANITSLLTGCQDPKKLDPHVIVSAADTFFFWLPERWAGPLRCRVGEDYEPDKECGYKLSPGREAMTTEENRHGEEESVKLAQFPTTREEI